MKKFMAILLSLILSTTLFAGTRDPSVPDEKYIEYGQKFSSVVKICGSYEDGRVFCASASLIDDHNFLTAAHVVQGANVCYITIEDVNFPIKSVAIHRDFKDPAMSPLMNLLEEINPLEETEEKVFGFGDIAIGYSEKPFGLKYYPPLYTDEDEVGKVCSIAGYGLTGTFHTGINRSDNKKRAGSNIIDSISDDKLICSPSQKHDQKCTSLEFMIGSGDSGGGLFIDGKLAGINSCVMAVGRSPSSKYGEESGHTRVSKFIQWIRQNTK